MSDLLIYTADIVTAYVSNNKVAAADLPALISSTFAALTGADLPAAEPVEEPTKVTAAQIRKSLTPDKLISFLDGKGYSMLKRHLSTHGLTPEAYRERFGLPKDYPMVATSYAAQRSALALKIGLGSKGRSAAPGKVVKATGAKRPANAIDPATDDFT